MLGYVWEDSNLPSSEMWLDAMRWSLFATSCFLPFALSSVTMAFQVPLAKLDVEVPKSWLKSLWGHFWKNLAPVLSRWHIHFTEDLPDMLERCRVPEVPGGLGQQIAGFGFETIGSSAPRHSRS